MWKSFFSPVALFLTKPLAFSQILAKITPFLKKWPQIGKRLNKFCKKLTHVGTPQKVWGLFIDGTTDGKTAVCEMACTVKKVSQIIQYARVDILTKNPYFCPITNFDHPYFCPVFRGVDGHNTCTKRGNGAQCAPRSTWAKRMCGASKQLGFGGKILLF